MERLRKELTFDGGVNLDVDPHLLRSNEWLKLKNMWPYRNKLIGSRPSLLHEQDILPVPEQNWNYSLFYNSLGDNPTNVKWYGQWFRHLTPLKVVFMGSLDRVAMVCVCNLDGRVTLNEQFEGEAATQVTLTAGECVLIILPNDLQSGPATGFDDTFPTIAGVRLGSITNITPSLISFNDTIVAANKSCEYVVQVVPSSSLALPSATTWPGIDYRFTKVNFGDTNLDFRADGVIVYKNRFVYWRGNKLWFSDPFQPGLIYQNAVATAFLAVFFDTGLTDDITALGNIYMSDVEEAGKSVLAVWSKTAMVFVTGEPATTIASSPEELFAACVANSVSVPAGCVSAASVVKTKFGYIWCGAESVWFMAKGNLPVNVGQKIAPRIQAQSFESAGRIFATFDDLCYRLVINAPEVGYNPYSALNEMWCLSFAGDKPSETTAAWFGPQVFTNTDNPNLLDNGDPNPYGPGGVSHAGLYCCAKLTNINDDKTWYIQPYSYSLGTSAVDEDMWGTRIGLCSLSTYLGVDITAPFRMVAPIQSGYTYEIGAVIQNATGAVGDIFSYGREFLVTVAGQVGGTLQSQPIICDSTEFVMSNKRLLLSWMEGGGGGLEPLPEPYIIEIQSGYLTLDNPELLKLIDGYELTFKTLNPVVLSSWWWPWESPTTNANIVVLESTVNVPQTNQNVLGNMWNEPVLTARRIPAPPDRRYNGLTAQLNIMDTDYTLVDGSKIVTSNTGVVNPNWNLIRISTDNVNWIEFNLFDFDDNGIARYANLVALNQLLEDKVVLEVGKSLTFSDIATGLGFKFGDNSPLYIDLTAQGWEWFGFVPTGRNNGWGVNILSNTSTPTLNIPGNGPVPFYTPHNIHFAKLAVRYSLLEARPR